MAPLLLDLLFPERPEEEEEEMRAGVTVLEMVCCGPG